MVLRSAITVPARLLGLEGSHGAVREGYVGDLVLVDVDPLEHLEFADRIRLVLKDGRVAHRAAAAEYPAPAQRGRERANS